MIELSKKVHDRVINFDNFRPLGLELKQGHGTQTFHANILDDKDGHMGKSDCACSVKTIV